MLNNVELSKKVDRSGSKNPAWKRGYIIFHGYKYVSIGNKKRRFEHRLVMEKYLGRELTRKEIIHHKDGNKLNNELSNLELMTQSKHIKEHIKNNQIGGRISYEKGKRNINCEVCLKEVTPNSPAQKYCNICKKKIKYS